MPVWFENDAPNTRRVSASFMSQLATGVPERPSTPPASGWWSGIWPLALNVVSDRCVERLGQRDDLGHRVPGAVADDHGWPRGSADERAGLGDHVGIG